jgi:hypothetical protein
MSRKDDLANVLALAEARLPDWTYRTEAFRRALPSGIDARLGVVLSVSRAAATLQISAAVRHRELQRVVDDLSWTDLLEGERRKLLTDAMTMTLPSMQARLGAKGSLGWPSGRWTDKQRAGLGEILGAATAWIEEHDDLAKIRVAAAREDPAAEPPLEIVRAALCILDGDAAGALALARATLASRPYLDRPGVLRRIVSLAEEPRRS